MSTPSSTDDLLAALERVAPRDGELALRALRATDLERVVECLQDPEIPRWTLVPSPYGMAEARAFLRDSRNAAHAGLRLSTVLVELPADRVIGSIGLVDIDRARAWGEIGYWVAADVRGRGVAVRAIGLVRELARALGLTTLDAFVEPGNGPSRRTVEKAGFASDGALVAVERCGDVEPARLRYRWSAS